MTTINNNKKQKQVRFLKDDLTWAVMRTLEDFNHLWKEARWDFVVDGERYSAEDWRGREAAEKMFAE